MVSVGWFEGMVSDLLLVLLTAGFAVVASLVMLIIALIIAPKKPNKPKEIQYECGQIPSGAGKFSLMMQYYAYLLMFVAFDVMSMFLFAWGVSIYNVGLSGFLAVVLFIGILLVPLAFTLYHAARREIW
jgi:NADH-quinone oxidoreductase subunit A